MPTTAKIIIAKEAIIKASEAKEVGYKNVFERAQVTKINRIKGGGPTIFVKSFVKLTNKNKTAVIIDKQNKQRPVRLTSIESLEGNFDKIF